MGTLLEAIKVEKSFAITPASLGYAFSDGMGIAESLFGDRSYGVVFGGARLDTGGFKSVGFRLRLHPNYKYSHLTCTISIIRNRLK